MLVAKGQLEVEIGIGDGLAQITGFMVAGAEALVHRGSPPAMCCGGAWPWRHCAAPRGACPGGRAGSKPGPSGRAKRAGRRRGHRQNRRMSFGPASVNLTHHFLIARPGLEDAAFARSVVYLCEHSERGALGLIINKPTDITLKGLFDKVDLSLRREAWGREPVFQGGPVQTERGFVLHEPMPDEGRSATDGSAYASTMVIPGGLAMTTSKDVLEALSTGAGPRRVLITLGYSSWGGGQLESELAENAWLTVAADLSVIFDTPAPERYDRALSLLGLEVWMLSPSAGHA